MKRIYSFFPFFASICIKNRKQIPHIYQPPTSQPLLMKPYLSHNSIKFCLCFQNNYLYINIFDSQSPSILCILYILQWKYRSKKYYQKMLKQEYFSCCVYTTKGPTYPHVFVFGWICFFDGLPFNRVYLWSKILKYYWEDPMEWKVDNKLWRTCILLKVPLEVWQFGHTEKQT